MVYIFSKIFNRLGVYSGPEGNKEKENKKLGVFLDQCFQIRGNFHLGKKSNIIHRDGQDALEKVTYCKILLLAKLSILLQSTVSHK